MIILYISTNIFGIRYSGEKLDIGKIKMRPAISILQNIAVPLFCLLIAACITDKTGQHTNLQNQEASDNPSSSIIYNWANTQYKDRLIGLKPIRVFIGDFNGDSADDGLAFIYYHDGGNTVFLDVALFRNDGKKLIFWRKVNDVFGQDPRDVSFNHGRIEVTTTVPKSNDPRCCLTGERRWEIITE